MVLQKGKRHGKSRDAFHKVSLPTCLYLKRTSFVTLKQLQNAIQANGFQALTESSVLTFAYVEFTKPQK